jgi:hypothetical protein
MLSPVFDAFVEASPITVMMRGLMEHIFNFERMNQIFSTYSVTSRRKAEGFWGQCGASCSTLANLGTEYFAGRVSDYQSKHFNLIVPWRVLSKKIISAIILGQI